MADHHQQSEGHHHQADVPMPAVPGAGLVVGEPEFGLGRLERVLDRPTPALDCRQGRDRRAGRAPRREVRSLAIAEAAADEKPSRPQAALIVVGTIKVGQFAVGRFCKVMQARAWSGLLPVSRTPGLGVMVKPEVLHAASQVWT